MRNLSTTEQRVLSAINERWATKSLLELVAIPSISDSAAESEAQHRLAGYFDRLGLDTDIWAIDLSEAMSHPDFPGTEVPRTEAWGFVGTTGGGDGTTLILNGHIDVVPPGDRSLWTGDPFHPRLVGDVAYGRGTCDMKAGVVAERNADTDARLGEHQLPYALSIGTVVAGNWPSSVQDVSDLIRTARAVALLVLRACGVR